MATQGYRGEDSAALLREHADRAHEIWVGVEHLKLLRERVAKCYKREGVNHFENCSEHVAAYIAALRQHTDAK